MALKKKYKALIVLILLIGLGAVFYTFFIRISQIRNDEVGVIVNFSDSTVDAVRGDIVYMPLRSQLYVYPTTIQVVTYDSLPVMVKDGVRFAVSPCLSYQLQASKADLFYEKCGRSLNEIKDGFVKEQVRAIYSDAASLFTADSLVYNKQGFEIVANAKLTKVLESVGLVLVSSNSNLCVPHEIDNMVNLRVEAIQKAILAENRLREVDAQRREDSLRNSALTPLAIQKMFIEKWDGKLSPQAQPPKIYKDITE